MSASIAWSGLTEFRAALRAVPADLSDQAGAIVDRHARNAASGIRGEYQQHRVTGRLAGRVTVNIARTGLAPLSVVRSAAPHAALFEFGTQLRRTKSGANRGSAPPHPTVIPIAQRERRAMNQDLIGLVKAAGFDVSGVL